MASKKKQKGMVFHQEGATTPAAALAADHPTARFVVPKPGKASEGGMERSTCVTNEETGMKGKPNMYPSKEPIRTSGGLAAAKHSTSSNPQPDNLSPDSICKGIKVTLDNNSMWNEFFRCKTEMILTQQGSRMFPYCRFRISGLQSSKKYSLIMDIQPLDNSRYKWTGKSWQVAGKAECHVKSQPFAHPESPSTGQHWMQNPVSFYKLKLTNNISDQEGNTILHPTHRYLPRLHVVQTDKAAKDIKLNGPNVLTFTFPQTEFMAVTAYQNSRFSQLKVDYNPFAKGLKEEGSSSLGLKLKLNSGKDSHKVGGTTSTEQHPVKKSLKSLLANHKPRSSKAVDAKPSGSGDLQKNSTTNKDQSAASVAGECSRSNSRPAQKLFSELIREAHVSLHRCNLEELGITNSTSNRTERTNTKTTALKSNGQDVPKRDNISVKTQSKTTLAKKSDVVASERKVKGGKDLLNSLNCKDNVGTDCSEVNNVAAPEVSQNSSVDSNQQRKTEAPSEAKVKQHKRPAPLPLPALALFLKQHSSKSKVAKSKLDSSPAALPSESLSDSQSSAAAPACPPSDQDCKAAGPSKILTGDITKSSNQASRHAAALPNPGEMVLNVTGQAGDTTHQPSSPSCPDAFAPTDPQGKRTDNVLNSVSVAESTGPEPVVSDGTPVLPNSDQPSCTFGTSVSTISSTLATSSTSSISSPTLDTVLAAPNSPQTPTIPESSTLPSDSPTMKSDSLLPDPECSSFGFEPLSPASSPEPLPSLPMLLALDLDSTTSEPPPKAVSPEELQHSEDSASVFKWHTVLPQTRPYMDTPFTTFQPTPQTLPLESVPSPLLPSQSPSHPEPQTLDTSTSTPLPDSAPSFQENESLPFPAELSPLALHLPLSPTFSSLDGDALSPTPSIADLVHFFSTDDDLGMEVEFSNTEAVAAPCPPPSTVEANAREPSQQVQPIPAKKPCKGRKKSQRRKLAKTDVDQNMDAATYTSMRPNLEEVEEQLFISFTSKEALKLHIADSSVGTVSQPQTTPECHLQQTADAPENVETAESLEEKIAAFEKILLRDLRLMRHRQVIHPVLQEVGLKLNLLDPTLAIDLQYLGVRLPIPPPGVSLEPQTQELPPPQGVSAAFVSRTGKTTDVTQIKGWRGKFTPSEAPPTPTTTKPEAGPSSDPPKKNLSAFCSDMLDEYLENEGKLIDERAASFSQPQVEPVVYELPTKSTSYVRTLNSVLKKQPSSSPTSDLISGFIPPSKRPKLPTRETKTSRKGNMRQKGPKHLKPRAEPGLTAAPSPAESSLPPKQSTVLTAPPSSEHTAPITEPHTPKKHRLKVRLDHTDPLTLSSQPKKRKKLKPKTLSQTLSPHKSMLPQPGISEDLAPLESDSELGTTADQNAESCRQNSGPPMTRALLRQKDLEEEVVWGGRPRTSITEERATVALTSLFTLMGFVSENPTAPIQLVRRRAPRCLNEFCRLGCVCSSLSHCVRISHCGRPQCMLGCSCLKQKVVLLKNLDASDSSPSQQGNIKKKKRKRRMKMAYILKEADSVTQPAERVRTLWKRDSGDLDPDPVNVPKPAALSRPPVKTERREDSISSSSCARVRAYRGKTQSSRKQKRKDQLQSHDDPPETSKDVKSKKVRLKSLKQRDLTLKDTETKPSSPPPAADPLLPAPSAQPPSPPAELPPKPSKRLIILAECKWANDSDRSLVLKNLCEAMAWDRLDEPFWIKKYLISPISQTVEDSGSNRCIQYKIHISRPLLESEKPEKPVKPVNPPQQRKGKETTQQQKDLEQVVMKAEPTEDWQREVMEDKEEEEEAEPLEDWQREVVEEEEEEEEEEAKPLEDWQREVEEDDFEEETESTEHQLHDGGESDGEDMKMWSKTSKKMMVSMALPFLTGISPAGFLSANKQQPGGADHPVQVNGKLYPLAKIQLGRMGALHPANRLAAYLTGRVGLTKKPQSSSSSLSKPPQNQSSAPTAPTVSSSSSVVPTPTPKSQPSAAVLTIQTSPTVLQPAAVKLDQSAASSDQPAGEAPEGAGTRVVTLKVYPGPREGGTQFRVIPAASGSSAPTSGNIKDSKVSSSAAPPVTPALKGSQVFMVQVPPSPPTGKLPLPVQPPHPPPPSSTYTFSSGQRIVLQPVQSSSGLQYFRKPDGKLVRLVPLSQLRSANPNPSAPRASPSVLPATSLQAPVVSTGNQKPTQTTATSTLPSHSPSPLSGLQSFKVSPLTSQLRPASGFLSQKGTCTFKILPANNNKDPIIITCPKVPPKVVSAPGSFTVLQPQPPNATPVNLISLKPSTGQGAELGVKTVTVSAVPVCPGGVSVVPVSPSGVSAVPVSRSGVSAVPVSPSGVSAVTVSPSGVSAVTVGPRGVSAVPVGPGGVSAVPVGPGGMSLVPVGPGGVLVHQKPAIQIPYRPPPPPPAPPESEITPASPPKPEPACNLLDLDIICVDDEAELIATETGGEVKQLPDVVEMKVLSSETENSSDFSDESEVEEEKEPTSSIQRLTHNMLEKQRRRKLRQLFESLRREVGLNEEKTSKISTLKKSVEVIQELWRTEKDLEKKKEKLIKRRDNYLAIIAPITEESRQVSSTRQTSPELSEGRGTGSKVTDVVDLLDDTDELTENSSDEGRPVTKTTNAVTVTKVEDEVQTVVVETVEEGSRLNAAQRKLARILRNEDSESSVSVKKLAYARSVADAFRALQSVMNTNSTSRSFLLEQAHQEIRTLQSENGRLRSLKICLNQQRDAYIREISQRSGKSKERIRSILQHLSSKQKEMEMQERLRAANQLPAVGGGASDPPTGDLTDDVVIITSSSLQQQRTLQAPPTPVSVPATSTPASTPSSTPASTPVPTPVQTPVQQPQRVLQVSNPILAPPGVSHSVSVVRDRPRTVPNILSRSKNPAASKSIQAVVPAEILSLVGTALPGQPVLTLSPVMAAPTMLQTSSTPGVASVTLNISNLTNQQIHLTSLPQPPTGKIYSSSAPLTITNLTAADLNNLLQLVQPSTTQQQQQQQQPLLQPPQTKQQILQTPPPPPPPPQQQQQQPQTQPQQETQQPQPPPPQQQQIPAGPPPSPPPAPPPAPLLVVSAESDPITDQDQPPSQTDTTSESSPFTQDPSPTPRPGASADHQAEVTEAGPVGAEPQQQETRDDESLTSLLNEIVFLNQQTVTTAGTPLSGKPSSEDDVMDGDEEQGHTNSPWLLELDSDSDETVATEMEAAAVNDHTDMTVSAPQPGPVNGNAKGGALAPPPLLQMKVGGAKVADPSSCDGAAGGEVEGEGGGRREGGVAWRPMPRLVPLGLRGNPPS